MYGQDRLSSVFGDNLNIRSELSQELVQRERSMLYREVTVGELV
jgi:hypothetical protein